MHILNVKNEHFDTLLKTLPDSVHVDPCSSLNEAFDLLASSQNNYIAIIFSETQDELAAKEAISILHENYPELHIILTTKETSLPNTLKTYYTLGISDFINDSINAPELENVLIKLKPKETAAQKVSTPIKTKKEIKKNAGLATRIFENSPVGLIVLDKKNNIAFWNSIASELTHLSQDEVIGKSFLSLFDVKEINPKFAVISKVNPKTFQTEYYKALFSENLESKHNEVVVSLIDINDRIEKEKESNQLLNQMVILNDLSRTISTSITIDEFLENLSQQLIWIYAPSIASIYFYDSSEDMYFLAFYRAADGVTTEPNRELTDENSPLIKLLDDSKPQIYGSKEEHNNFNDLEIYETIVYYPVVNKNETVAIITMGSENKNHFSEASISSLELLTDIVSICLQNVMLYENVTEKNNELGKVVNDLKDAKEAIEQQAGYLSQLLEETEQARRLIEKQNEEKERELNKAAVLQDNLLPEKMFESDICAFESIYIPCNEVAGDIYDVIKFDDGRIGIIIADVSDHGVSSAMIAAMFKMVFLIYAKQYDSPKDVFEKVNVAINETINTGDYVTAFYGILSPDTKEFRYASAGHPAAIVCDAFGENIRLLNTDGFFIGMFDFSDYEEKTITLESGDHILMYTDGIYEIKNKAEEEYSKERLETNFINTIKDMNMFPLATLLVTAEEYAEGIPYDDDLTLLHTIIK